MKINLLLPALLIAASMVQGCDFMRTVAGRPTSDVIAGKKAAIEREDSIRREEEASRILQQEHERRAGMAMSALDSCIMSSRVSEIGNRLQQGLGHKYYVVIGAFSNSDNAERLCGKLAAEGFDSELILYRNGQTAVGAVPSDDVVALYDAYLKLKDCPFCPNDAWLLINE